MCSRVQLFESYVILDTTKTGVTITIDNIAFESYVILDTTKTHIAISSPINAFESYVILHYIKVLCMSRATI